MHARLHHRDDSVSPLPSPRRDRGDSDASDSPRTRSRSSSRVAPYIAPIPSQKKSHLISSTKCSLYTIFTFVTISLIGLFYITQRSNASTEYKLDSLYLLGNLNFCPDEYCWPRIYLIGAAKSGTTSLWSVLRSRTSRGLCIPEAVDGDPKWYRKEGTFFSVDSHFYANYTPKKSAREHYKLRYPKRNCHLPSRDSFLDATPSYLSHPLAAVRMKSTYKDLLSYNIRFVAVLRNPIDRDLSWYKVGEGLRSNAWWDDKLRTCGVSEFANAKCYDNSVKEEIIKWDSCISKVLKLPCSYQNMSAVINVQSSYDGNLRSVSSNNNNCYNKISSTKFVIQDLYSKCYQSSRLSHGIYISQVLYWINEWGRDKVFIIKTAELLADSRNNIERIAEHLSLKLNLTGWTGMPKENDTSKKKFFLNFTPFCSTISTLATFYKPYNDMLIAHLRRTSASAPPTEPFFKDIDPAEFPECIPDIPE